MPVFSKSAVLRVTRVSECRLAVAAIPKDGTVIKYGVDIGRAIAPIAPGEHLHVHNVKTKRW